MGLILGCRVTCPLYRSLRLARQNFSRIFEISIFFVRTSKSWEALAIFEFETMNFVIFIAIKNESQLPLEYRILTLHTPQKPYFLPPPPETSHSTALMYDDLCVNME